AIDGAPAKGRTIALRFDAGQQFVYVAGMAGVKAGTVDPERKWHDAAAPDSQYATVLSRNRSSNDFVVLPTPQQPQVLVTEPRPSKRSSTSSSTCTQRTSTFSSRGRSSSDAGSVASGFPRRSICRNDRKRPIASGSVVSALLRRCSSRKCASEPISSGSAAI